VCRSHRTYQINAVLERCIAVMGMGSRLRRRCDRCLLWCVVTERFGSSRLSFAVGVFGYVPFRGACVYGAAIATKGPVMQRKWVGRVTG
jgi:hypothetical protein